MKKRVIALGLAALMIISIFFMNNTRVSAMDKGAVSYSTSTSTVLLSDGFYSSSASLTPSPSKVDIGVNPATIQKVVIEDITTGVQIGAPLTLSSGSIYSLPAITGQAKAVNVRGLTSYSGYFKWLRNARSNTWTFDDDNAVTHHSTDAAPPNDSYNYYTIPSQSYVWGADPNDNVFHVITHPSGFAVSGGTVPIEATNVTLTHAGFELGSEPAPNLQIKATSFVNGYDAKIEFTETFNYSITRLGMFGNYVDPSAIWYQYNNKVHVDYEATTYYYPSNWHIVAYVNTLTPTPTPSPVILGDFQVNPSTINYRDSFTLHPLAFTIPAGCTYTDHYYKIERGGISVQTSKLTAQTQDTTYTYSSYPSVIAVGTHNISLMIDTSCGSSGWIGPKTLTVNGPTSNRPPDFILGWVYPGTKTPVTQVVQGTKLDLVYIDDPTVPTPIDPDGDPIFFDGFNFSNSDAWTKTIPTKSGVGLYTDGYHSITMDGLGNHSASASFHDIFGASATKSTSVNVIPPNPVPVCKAPVFVKENRPIAAGAINADSSYSPLNRTIDHTKDVWVNKLSSYINGTSSDITVQATLQKITDSAGLDSLGSSTCNIIVHPDLPPVGSLAVPPLGIRGQSYDIFNQFTSPDGDTLVSIQYKYKYDAYNNGFSDDAWTSLPGDLTKAVFTPTKVGKYLFYAMVCEDYGKCGDTSTQSQATLTLDITNLPPEVSFKVEGNNPLPNVNVPTLYTADVMINNWNLYQVNKNIHESKMAWYKNSLGALAVGLGKGMESQNKWSYTYCPGQTCYPAGGFLWANNNGFGNNRISAWRAMQSVQINSPILIPMGGYYGDQRILDPAAPYSKLIPAMYSSMMFSNKKYLFFDQSDPIYCNGGSYSYVCGANKYIYAMNKSKVPRYQYNIAVDAYNNATLTHQWLDPNPYDFILGPGTSYRPSSQGYSVQGYSDFTMRYPTGMVPGAIETYINQDFKFSDSNIARITSWYHPTAAVNSCDNSGYCNYQYTNSYYVYDINVYDSTSGANIKNFQIAPNTDPVLAGYTLPSFELKGDKFIASLKAYNFSRWDYSCWCSTPMSGPAKTIEYDFNGNILSQYNPTAPAGLSPFWETISARYQNWMTGVWYSSAPAAYICTPNLLGDRKYDGEGNSYQYMRNNCVLPSSTSGTGINGFDNPTSSAGANLVKFDKNGAVVWVKRLRGNDAYANPYYYQRNVESGQFLFVLNPYTRQIIVKTLNTATPPGSFYAWSQEYDDMVNMDTGAVVPSPLGIATETSSPSVNPNTGAFEVTTCSYTIEGLCSGNTAPTSGNLMRLGSNSWVQDVDYLGNWQYSEYFGDGLMLSMYELRNNYSAPGYSASGQLRGSGLMWITKGPPTTSPIVRNAFKLGQFISLQPWDNAEITFTMQMNDDTDVTNLAGMSFRMQDAENRYAVETNGTTLYLSKYVGSARTVLSQIPWTFVSKSSYDFKIRTLGTKIEVSLNKAPVFSVVDSHYASGKLGPFTQKSFVSFGSLLVKNVQDLSVFVGGYAIWDQGSATASVRYSNILFTDPENDPMSNTFQWSYTHIPKFINNQGISALVGQTFSSSQLQFDKVGEYTVSLRAQDDPYPDIAFKYPSMVFDAYRKWSNTFQSKLIVHRRPIAVFTLAADASGVITWTDTSYDPDRYDNLTGAYSTENTGLNYQATRGVFDWQYYYITPSGVTVNSKLTRPQEMGTYIVGMQVKDEYGAWSDFATQSFTTARLAPPNQPPAAAVTNPNGTLASPTIMSTIRPNITWSQTDPDVGAIFKQYQVQISNESGSIVLDSGIQNQNTTSTTANWTVNMDLLPGQKLQVRVRVNDGMDWSNWSAPTWMLINSPPTATMTVPGGTQAAPTIFSSLRPTMQWSQTDPDAGTIFKAFQIQITNEANNVMILDSGQLAQNTTSTAGSWTVTSNLPVGQKLRVWVRVNDGNVWSSYSAQTWMFINRAPLADFDWSPKPAYDGDTLTMKNQSSDPDGDVLTHQWTVTAPSGGTIVSSGLNISLSPAEVGTYKVTLQESDPYGGTNSVIKNVIVLPLGVIGSVTHTADWEHNRQLFNIEKSGDANTPWSINQFLIGERFMLDGTITTIISPSTVSAINVKVTFEQTGDVTWLTPDTSKTRWTGDLWNVTYNDLTPGTATFKFTATFSNGAVKTDIVPVEILKQSVRDFWLLKRDK
ncbi:PKD domain-containing protein [Paenibacillus sp. GP183]|uniref:glycoside hydrolase family 78 protein n=1 Tax=Paenibacillus sp. GP183 TaxID=1882751 RepID=UPI000897B8AE|nr:PKD domain-containing protein [Paenibacillus sp. GP183]SED12915.1 hypothetical protein SAMN05443246_5833 [Paenibacillus sp. GP183]